MDAAIRYYASVLSLGVLLHYNIVSTEGSSEDLRDRAARLRVKLRQDGRPEDLADAMEALADARDPALTVWQLLGRESSLESLQ